ncbi:unnamed protein product [Chondrus crispus]|uniref:Uncharacterized protein n=1 Tax=Chondrus crispus TaxID=2769 RepID=R7QS11_CHOCR|nr:unnamed protein product [Chondrus crispus]CDF40498.1 unnamed protein product [Chondrus crispus]|eukprot:XP_005710792.1 unnamed protein product [Chondrus crispus]
MLETSETFVRNCDRRTQSLYDDGEPQCFAQRGYRGVERDAVRSMELYERAIEKVDDVDAMLNCYVPPARCN